MGMSLDALDNIQVSPAIVRQSVAYARASALGHTVEEMKPRQQKDVDEFSHIYELVWGSVTVSKGAS